MIITFVSIIHTNPWHIILITPSACWIIINKIIITLLIVSFWRIEPPGSLKTNFSVLAIVSCHLLNTSCCNFVSRRYPPRDQDIVTYLWCSCGISSCGWTVGDKHYCWYPLSPRLFSFHFRFGVDLEKMSSGKQLVKGKSGLRMIAVSEDERCPFLLEEPHWTDDTQV